MTLGSECKEDAALVSLLTAFIDSNPRLDIWRRYPDISEAEDEATDTWACGQVSQQFAAFAREHRWDAVVIRAVGATPVDLRPRLGPQTFAVFFPVGKSIFKNGGKVYPDLAMAQAARPDQEIAPFPLQLTDGEFFDVGAALPENRFKSWGSYASYPDAFTAAEQFRKTVTGYGVVIKIMTLATIEHRGKDAQGHDVILGRTVEYDRVRVSSRVLDSSNSPKEHALPDQSTDTFEPSTTEANEQSQSAVLPRALTALWVGFIGGVLLVGGTLGVRYFVFEPMEQKAAFIEVVSSSNEEPRAKSYDELIDLKANVHRFSGRMGMYLLSMDQEDRIDRAIATKRSGA